MFRLSKVPHFHFGFFGLTEFCDEERLAPQIVNKLTIAGSLTQCENSVKWIFFRARVCEYARSEILANSKNAQDRR